MTEQKGPNIARILLKRLARGGTKSVPLVGSLLDEIVFGTLDEAAAAREAPKVANALAEAQQKLEGQSATLDEVLAAVRSHASLQDDTRRLIEQLATVLRDDQSPVPEVVEQAVERLVQRYGQRLEDATATFESLLDRMEDALSRTEVPDATPPRSPTQPPIWNVPHSPNTNFTGRGSLLDGLREALMSGQPAAVTQAISGLGGVGKTQLAVEYVYRHIQDYSIVWWMRAEEPAALASDYAALAQKLELSEKDATDQGAIRGAVRQWLEQHEGWLLVFDNTPGPSEVREYLPKAATGHVIITSRSPTWAGVARPLRVEVFDRAESVDFLLRRTGQPDEDAAEALAEELGDLPLALEQAGAYMEATGRPLSEYLEMFRASQLKILKRYPPATDYEETVATTWELSFQGARAASPASAGLLRLCAFLAPDDIPKDLLGQGSEHLPKALRGVVSDPEAFDEAIAAPRRYSLVEAAGDSLSVHRLVQAVVRERLGKGSRKT